MLRSPEQRGRSGSDRDEPALLALGRSSATRCCRGGNIDIRLISELHPPGLYVRRRGNSPGYHCTVTWRPVGGAGAAPPVPRVSG
jgi:hypothetical protein